MPQNKQLIFMTLKQKYYNQTSKATLCTGKYATH